MDKNDGMEQSQNEEAETWQGPAAQDSYTMVEASKKISLFIKANALIFIICGVLAILGGFIGGMVLLAKASEYRGDAATMQVMMAWTIFFSGVLYGTWLAVIGLLLLEIAKYFVGRTKVLAYGSTNQYKMLERVDNLVEMVRLLMEKYVPSHSTEFSQNTNKALIVK